MSMQDKRKFKTQWLITKVYDQSIDGLGYRKDLLLAEFCQFFGASSQLAPRFLNELKILDKLIEKDKMIYHSDFYDNFGNKKEVQQKLDETQVPETN